MGQPTASSSRRNEQHGTTYQLGNGWRTQDGSMQPKLIAELFLPCPRQRRAPCHCPATGLAACYTRAKK